MKQNILAAFIVVAGLLSGAYFFPWSGVNWGNLGLTSPKTLTVIGHASSSVKNEVASFYAGVSAVNDNKDAAVAQVNQQMKKTISALKNFGIPEADIQTSNISIYQNQDSYYDEQGKRKTRPGQWSVSNNITIKLRNTEQASALNDLLVSSGLTNVSGPNFSQGDVQADGELISQAIADAREKATVIAKGENLMLGQVLSINESGVSSNYMNLATGLSGGGGGGGGAPVSQGSSTVSTSVVVTFELK